MPAPRIETLLVIGVGLIGGSLARALRERGQVGRVIGIGRTRANLQTALRAGVIDEAITPEEDWTPAVRAASVVLVATPVAQYRDVFVRLAPHVRPQALVTDAGSTKQDVVAVARATLGAVLSRFVPGHPVAGSERSGAAAADPRLYEGREVILTPLADTDADAQSMASALWQSVGARVTLMSAEAHDRLLATVSHLPHVLAFALIELIARRPDAGEVLAHAGGGLRDTTRIAASSPEMWRDIALANRAAVLDELGAYRNVLDEIIGMLARADAAALTATFARAATLRRTWAGTSTYPRADGPGDEDA